MNQQKVLTPSRGSIFIPKIKKPPHPGMRCAYPGLLIEPLRGTDPRSPEKPENKRKSRRTKRLQGTPTPYLPSVACVGFMTWLDVNSWLKGAPDPHAVRHLEIDRNEELRMKGAAR